MAEKLKKEQAASVVLTPAVNPNNPIQKPIVEKAKVIAYYLHATGRCSNCIKIEAWSKAALDKFFVKEQKNGKLQFIVLNIDEGENRHFVEDYKLVTKSLVLSLVKNGKEINYEVLSGVWNYLNDENAFYQYVKGRTDEFLKASE